MGKALWAALSLLGLAALLAASATAYQLGRLAGAAYLVWLGVQAMRSARRHTGDLHPAASSQEGERRLSTVSAFRRGLLGDALNPKVARWRWRATTGADLRSGVAEH